MNDEIKEILECMEKCEQLTPDAIDDLHYIKNYITNLQQELKIMVKDDGRSQETIIRLTKENERLKTGTNDLCDTIDYFKEQVKDYKSRCEKAIEYIKTNCILSDEWTDLGFCNFIPTGKISYKSLSAKKVKILLNILQNGSDEK